MSIITQDNLSYYELSAYEGKVGSMYKLADYYKNNKDYENMIKYYMMAIQRGEKRALQFLSEYYNIIGAYKKMFKCYLLGVQMDDWFCKTRLVSFLKKTEDKIIYFNLLIKYEIIFNEEIQKELCEDEILKDLILNYLLKEQMCLA